MKVEIPAKVTETLTTHEVARSLRCTPAALRRMRAEDRGPRWVRVGRLVRYPSQWVDEWLAANEGGVTHGK